MNTTIKLLGKSVVALLAISTVILIFNWEKANRLYNVITLFDADKIVHNFSNMEAAFLAKPIHSNGHVFQFEKTDSPLPESFTYKNKVTATDEFLKRRATTALLVIKDDKIHYEDYYLGTTDADKRISWSMAKSFVSILFGIQVDQGKIDIEKPVDFYLDEMKGTGYEGVKVKHVLQMSSGVKWDENYLDFNSDINKMGRLLALGGSLDEMTTELKNEKPAGEVFHYVSMDTHVISMITRRVAGKSIVELVQEHIWDKIGMEGDAAWITDTANAAFALGGLNVRTRDYARFGRLLLQNGNWNGEQIVSSEWIKEATTAGAEYLKAGEDKLGYGYQIWLPPKAEAGEFFCVGVYGQFIYVNQNENLVIVKNSADRNFMEAYGSKQETIEFFREIAKSLTTI